MKVPRRVKALLAVPLILVDTGLCLLAFYLLAVAVAGGAMAFPTVWWFAPLSAFFAFEFIATLIVVGTGTIEHVRDLRDPQRVLTCAFQGLGVNLLGVVLGILMVTLLLLSEFILTATH